MILTIIFTVRNDFCVFLYGELVMKKFSKFLPLFLMFIIIIPRNANAEPPSIKYIGAGIAFPTPTNYSDFSFGTGGYVDAGWITPRGLLIDVYYFDTAHPARSDRANDINLERVAGSGPTDYYSRALTVSAGISYLFFKAKVGISRREYEVKRPGVTDKQSAFGLSYGFGVNFNLYKNVVFSIDYNSIDHLIETGNIGLTIFFVNE